MASSAKSQGDNQNGLTERNAGGASPSQEVLARLGSLKVTVVLFAMSIFIILAGTLAQVDKDMWEVIQDYFRAWITWIDIQLFFPRSWFPNWQNIPGGFWFPGGALIGLGLVINLTAAHSTRFKLQDKGARRVAGQCITSLGVLITALVILGGHSQTAQQDEPPFASWQAVWMLVKLAVVAMTLASAYATWAVPKTSPGRWAERVLLGVVTLHLVALTVYLFVAGDKAYLGDSGMRILWQLIKAEIPALVLLLGLILLYGRRGGLVLIHGGLALMMFGQFYVAKYDVEEQLTVEEGKTVSYARDIRQTELAIVDDSDQAEEDVVVIPLSILLQSERGRPPAWFRGSSPVEENGTIRHEDLPFDVKVDTYYKAARLRDAPSGENNPATAGTGLRFVAEPVKASSGTDSRVDFSAAYVTLLEKDSSQKIGTVMVSQIASSQEIAEPVTVGGKTYDLSLRFKRNYKPYSVTLLDVRKDDYLGTSTPRNYSSDIHLVDSERDIDRKIHIWMNNPLRYAGETFYQSGYSGPPDFPVETTTLQVVTNSGWLIPYLACMLVGTGMLAHFWIVLLRFLRQRDKFEQIRWVLFGAGLLTGAPGLLSTIFVPRVRRKSDRDARTKPGTKEEPAKATPPDSAPGHNVTMSDLLGNIGLLLLLVVLAGWLLSTLMPPRSPKDEIRIHEFGNLPIIAGGRVKPIDTLARNSLRILSHRETFKDSGGSKQPAIRWLLDAIADPERADRHPVIRIVNMEVLDLLDLERRKSHLYSVEEIRRRIGEFEKQAIKARQKDVEKLSTFERKVIELDQRLRTYMQVGAAFQTPDLPPLPTADDDRETAEKKVRAFRDAYQRFVRGLDSVRPALVVPISSEGESEGETEWQSYARAWTDASISARLLGREAPQAVRHLQDMFVAYHESRSASTDKEKDEAVAEFNRQVAGYQRFLQTNPPPQLQGKGGVSGRFVERNFGTFYGFEAYFNHVAPFYHCSVLYLLAFVLAALAWLGWSAPLNRAAFLLITLTVLVHSVALLARMYISGRPPVTNLYSSAVFIGWGVVVLGLLYELFYRNGIGNVIGSVLGFGSLVVAHNLADGDTFTVLQAVLDTQFWLATHVVTVALGYATTFAAGGLGALYVLRGFFTPTLDKTVGKDLARMIYGTVCFSIFFSFIGTVLGGLWADDSWGRFWGWDPKENGALIIVLWNALVLHARWGGMVRDRGLAVLAVGGNIVTGWSWFGVNELGVGLHSYGFTEGALLNLGLFNASQLCIIAVGMLPVSLWWSFRIQSGSDSGARQRP